MLVRRGALHAAEIFSTLFEAHGRNIGGQGVAIRNYRRCDSYGKHFLVECGSRNRQFAQRALLTPPAIRAIPSRSSLRSFARLAIFARKQKNLKTFADFLFDGYGGSLSRMFRTPTGALREQLLAVHASARRRRIPFFSMRANTLYSSLMLTPRILERHALANPKRSYEDLRGPVRNAIAPRSATLERIPRTHRSTGKNSAANRSHTVTNVRKAVPAREGRPMTSTTHASAHASSSAEFSHAFACRGIYARLARRAVSAPYLARRHHALRGFVFYHRAAHRLCARARSKHPALWPSAAANNSAPASNRKWSSAQWPFRSCRSFSCFSSATRCSIAPLRAGFLARWKSPPNKAAA